MSQTGILKTTKPSVEGGQTSMNILHMPLKTNLKYGIASCVLLVLLLSVIYFGQKIIKNEN